MAKIHDSDRKASFMLIGDFNNHHSHRLNSIPPTDCHDILPPTSLVSWGRKTCWSSHPCLKESSYVLFTDIPCLLNVSVGASIGSINAAVQLIFFCAWFYDDAQGLVKIKHQMTYLPLIEEIFTGQIAVCHLLPPNSLTLLVVGLLLRLWNHAPERNHGLLTECREALRNTQTVYKLFSSTVLIFLGIITAMLEGLLNRFIELQKSMINWERFLQLYSELITGGLLWSLFCLAVIPICPLFQDLMWPLLLVH